MNKIYHGDTEPALSKAEGNTEKSWPQMNADYADGNWTLICSDEA